MRSALQLLGQPREERFVPGRAGRTSQIVSVILVMWQPSVSAIPYIEGVDLRGAHSGREIQTTIAGPGCQVKLG